MNKIDLKDLEKRAMAVRARYYRARDHHALAQTPDSYEALQVARRALSAVVREVMAAGVNNHKLH